MTEQLAERTPRITETLLPAGERLDLAEALGRVQRDGLAIYRFEDPSALDAKIVASLDDGKERLIEPHPAKPVMHELTYGFTNSLWDEVREANSAFVAIRGVANAYEPGMHFEKHYDIEAWQLVRSPPESALSFVYTCSGSKSMLFYLDGPEKEPLHLTQRPGQLFVFQGGDYVYDRPLEDGRTMLPALWHEVPPQETASTTLTWELGLPEYQ